MTGFVLDPAETDAGSSGRGLHHLVLYVLLGAVLTCEFLFATRLFRLINDLLQPVILGTMLAVALLAGGVMTLRGNFKAVLAFAAASSYMLFETVNYSVVTGDPLIITSVFQYVGFTLFIFVTWYVEVIGLRSFLSMFFKFSFIYAAIYVALALGSLAGAVPTAVVKAMVLSGDERGDRLYLHGAAVVYMFHAALNRQPGQRGPFGITVFNWAALGLSCMAILLSQSRFLTLVWAAVVALRFLRVSPRSCAFIATWVLFIAYLLSIVAVLRDDLNPFLIFGNDQSASVRSISFEIARDLILRYPVLGVGLESSGLSLSGFVGYLIFHWSDLGPVGIWFAFGLVGLMLSMMIAILNAFVPAEFQNEADRRAVTALRFTGITYAIQGIISPAMFTAFMPAAVVIGCILARSAGDDIDEVG